MAVKEELLEYIREALPFWKLLTADEKQEVENAVVLRMYRKGEMVHEGSEDCSGVMLVKEGQVRAYILSDAGKEITLYRLFERDICIFSAACIMRNITFDVFAEAEKDSEVLLIPTSVYNKLNHNNLSVSDFTNQIISSRFSDVMWIMEQVLFMSFDKRLAIFLEEERLRTGSNVIKLTQEQIARYTGSAREVVSRMLKYFAAEQMVEHSRQGVKILSPEKLQALIS